MVSAACELPCPRPDTRIRVRGRESGGPMTGKRVVFCTFGSLGDIHPFLSLAREMKTRGHFPIIATMPVYRQLIESQNIAFHTVPPDIDLADPAILRRVMDLRTGGRYIICEIVLPALRKS
jgi:rhamnosyltransferase subunit B